MINPHNLVLFCCSVIICADGLAQKTDSVHLKRLEKFTRDANRESIFLDSFEYSAGLEYAGGSGGNASISERRLLRELETTTDYYSHYLDTHKTIIKGVHAYTDNDILAIENEDDNYTGGLQVEIVTDFFRMKALSTRKDSNWFGYQTIYGGFEIYTPDSLGNCATNDPATCVIDRANRPFASYQFIGRSRNILSTNGIRRIRSDFRIGIIGGTLGQQFQNLLHRDVGTSARKPTGWITQIANGGRLALQYDLEGHTMIVSNNPSAKIKLGINRVNFYHIGGIGFGHLDFHVLQGVGFSTMDFFQKNHSNMVNVRNERNYGNQGLCNVISKGGFIELEARALYVGYNATLTGYPLLDEDNEKPDIYTIPYTQLSRITGSVTAAMGIRLYNTTIRYMHVIQFQEFETGDRLHYWGRIGLSFKV